MGKKTKFCIVIKNHSRLYKYLYLAYYKILIKWQKTTRCFLVTGLKKDYKNMSYINNVLKKLN